MSDHNDLAAGEAGWRDSNDGEPVPGDVLDQIAVGGGPQDAVVTTRASKTVRSRNHRSQPQVNSTTARAPLGVRAAGAQPQSQAATN